MNTQSSRRSFIKSSLVTGAATSMFPSTMLANEVSYKSSSIAAEEKGLVFLFQGDSITDGNRGRNTDPNHIMGHGYAFAVASRVGADFAERNFTFYNRGISGNRVPDLQKRWQTDTLDLKPDVLSILIGINDTGVGIDRPAAALSVKEFETGYRNILEQSRQANPNTLFALGVPFVFAVGKRAENWNLWNDGIKQRADIVYKLAKEFNAIVIDYPSVFNKAAEKASMSYWIWDGIHPTVFGHELMAREWIKQVSTRLKFLRHYKKSF